jgi:hypothetical protein
MLSKKTLKKAVLVFCLKLKLLFLTMLFSFSWFTTQAQCAMCRAAISNDANKTKAEAVNNGIVYLMGIPYILVGLLGIFIYKMYYKKTPK